MVEADIIIQKIMCEKALIIGMAFVTNNRYHCKHKKPVLHPVAPKKGNAGVRMLAGVLEVSLVHHFRDYRAHRKVVLALSVQGKSMLSLTEDPSPRSLGIVPTLA